MKNFYFYNIKGVLKLLNNYDLDLAIEIINMKIAKEIKNNKEKNFEKFKEKIINLKNQRKEIYKNNQEIIEKVLNEYNGKIE